MITPIAIAATLLAQVSGSILLDVQSHGEAWYVYPVSNERYFLGRPEDAFGIMRQLGLGISDADLARIPEVSSPSTGNLALRQRLSGRILLQVEQHGEAWYVYPGDLKRRYLGRPDDAFAIMRGLGLGISSADLASVPISPSSLTPSPSDASYRSFTVTNARGSFPVRVVTLARSGYRMVTDTAEPSDCASDCAAETLAAYLAENGAFAAIHGSYFCPPDYAPCAGKVNTYLPPVLNTALDRLINEDGLKHFARPMLAETSDGKMWYFHRAATDFGSSRAAFESREQATLTAAIGNWPSLVENGQVVVESEPMEAAFLTKGTRGAFGWNADSFFLVVGSSATVPDMAYILKDFGATFAMNLDGGGSAALYYDGAYRFGPGRLIPNAIVFRKR